MTVNLGIEFVGSGVIYLSTRPRKKRTRQAAANEPADVGCHDANHKVSLLVPWKYLGVGHARELRARIRLQLRLAHIFMLM